MPTRPSASEFLKDLETNQNRPSASAFLADLEPIAPAPTAPGFFPFPLQTVANEAMSLIRQGRQIHPTTFPGMLVRGASELLPASPTETGLMAGAELGIPLVGKALKIAAPAVGKLVANVPTGATSQIIKKGLEERPILPVMNQVDIQGILGKAADILEASRRRLGQAVGSIVDSFAQKEGAGVLVNAGDLAQEASQAILEKGIRSPGDIARSGVFGSPSNTVKFQSILKEIQTTPSLSPKRLYELKTQAQDILNIPPPGMATSLKQIGTPGEAIINSFTKGIDNILEGVVPGFKQANAKFSNKAKVYSALQKNIFSGDAVQKAGQLLNPNSKLNQAISNLSAATNSDMALIENLKNASAAFRAGSLVSDIPRTGFGAYLIGQNPEVGIPLLASTSPRLFGLGTQAGSMLAGLYRPGMGAAAVIGSRPFLNSNAPR